MTRGVQYYAKSKFSAWIKKYGPSSDKDKDAIDVQDVDYVLHSYLTGDLMTLETKEKGGKPSDAQKDTQSVIKQLLRLGAISGTVINNRGRKINYLGHYLVQFENTTPDDGWVKVDGVIFERDTFIRFLNFGRPKSQPQDEQNEPTKSKIIRKKNPAQLSMFEENYANQKGV